ncbi:gliding motility-associated C-terminal domain-containing protein [Maribacter aestuarii]|uniref:gliding motility-associated C-terminal domain-containing protein n=1 Tax=Maribacter aestuarii TaxID=1130723 RepID=UPI00248BD644|nr:gliding motility-associated C-terminal domain-containing protein [Maribacter aestuarii]
MNNKYFTLLMVLLSSLLCGQEVRNFGDLEIHENAQLGFYSAVENDGSLFASSGLVGFYGTTSYSFSGSFIPNIYDLEIANEEGVFLELPISVSNHMNFIYGNIATDRDQEYNFLELGNRATYQGESNFSKINGFAQSTVNESYIFPVGDAFYFRPLALKTSADNTVFKCAYFFENPLAQYSDNRNSGSDILAISQNEFWKLRGSSPVSVSLIWDNRSSLLALSSITQNITVIGYHKIQKEWVDLGASEITGTIYEGWVTSEDFIPDEYEVLTFGSVERTAPLANKRYNYILTPNDDGLNDFLYIPELENYRQNKLMVFDRNGLKVFEVENYTNEFTGMSGINIPSLNRDAGLPQGIYYYLVHLNNEELNMQGFLYLQRE